MPVRLSPIAISSARLGDFCFMSKRMKKQCPCYVFVGTDDPFASDSKYFATSQRLGWGERQTWIGPTGYRLHRIEVL